MKATSFLFVVLAASCLAGCPEEKATTPAKDQAKATPSAAPAAAPAAPAKPAEKKDEGGW